MDRKNNTPSIYATMATSGDQYMVRCSICGNLSAIHCEFCVQGLCDDCVLKYMTEKEVEVFSKRKEERAYKYRKCGDSCQGCKGPVCYKCGITHEIGKRQSQVARADILTIRDQRNYLQAREENATKSDEDFDNVTNLIVQREQQIHDMVRHVAQQIRGEVTAKKIHNRTIIADNNRKIAPLKHSMLRAIENIGNVFRTRDILSMIRYPDSRQVFTQKLMLDESMKPSLTQKEITGDQIVDLFGKLSFQKVKRLIDTPEVLATIPSHQVPLWRLLCVGSEKIWVSGNTSDVKQIDREGNLVQDMSFNLAFDSTIFCFSLDCLQNLVFSQGRDPMIEIYKDGDVPVIYMEFTHWIPKGLCHAKNKDLLVSLRSRDTMMSKVVRYHGFLDTHTFQYDHQGKPLFSGVSTAVLLLAENGNGDICVADCHGEEVVVVKASGGLRFRYTGSLHRQPKHKAFRPLSIAADVSQHILINDSANDVVHVIDRDGNFIRYIEYPCNGGLSLDADHNLVVGDVTSGEIRIIRYLE